MSSSLNEPLVLLNKYFVLVQIRWIEAVFVEINHGMLYLRKIQFIPDGFFNASMAERVFLVIADDDQYIHIGVVLRLWVSLHFQWLFLLVPLAEQPLLEVSLLGLPPAASSPPLSSR